MPVSLLVVVLLEMEQDRVVRLPMLHAGFALLVC
jgi:hypothetical protein